MKKILKNKIILVALLLFFIVGVTVGAATKYYEHVWTNDSKDVYYHNDFVTNDMIKVEDDFIAIGFYDSDPVVRILNKDGLIKKDVNLVDLVWGSPKVIRKVEDGYLIFIVNGNYVNIVKLSEDYKVDDIKEYNADFNYEDSFDLYVEEDDDYFYVISAYYVNKSIVKVKKDLSSIDEVLFDNYDEKLSDLYLKYYSIYDYVSYGTSSSTTINYDRVFVSKLEENYMYGLFDDTNEQSLLVYHTGEKEIWFKQIKGVFVREAIYLNGKILVVYNELESQLSYFEMFDLEGNSILKDPLNNYIDKDSVTFVPEHLLETGVEGFGLSGTEVITEDVSDGGTIVPDAGVPNRLDEKPPLPIGGQAPENALDGPADVGSVPPDAQAGGSYEDDYNKTAKVLYFNIIHQVITKTDGNGKVEATHTTASWGDAIKFTITPNEGYVLGEVKVYDINGNPVEFEKEGNSFIMPNIDVVIDVTFTVENVETITFMSLSIIVVAVISAIILVKTRKKAKFYEV